MIFALNSSAKDKIYRGKSTKKLFPEKQNFERVVSPQHKKLFPEFICLETRNKQKLVITRPVVKINKKFGNPTNQCIAHNDKKLLLPAEYNEKYNKSSYHKHSHSSINAITMKTGGNIMNTDCGNRYLSPKLRNYPYSKASIQDLLIQKNDPNKNNFTKKINQNRFDILKFVPKYAWEY